jgi:L-fucose isomerase-like protein
MTPRTELSQLSANRFVALILDNEVTVGHFVTSPPLSWTRLTQRNQNYQVAEGYPIPLTAEQTKIEMRTWDEVWLQGIMRTLKELEDSVDYVLIGNNAGQGLPLAQRLPQNLIGNHAAIIYGESLPEIREYEKMGYRNFFRRSQAVSRLLELANSAGRPLALLFINTIQHNESNYHDP